MTSMSDLNEESFTSVASIYPYVFDFERKFLRVKGRAWMSENWTYTFYFCGVYVFLIFFMKHFMQSRPRFELRNALIGWNTMLAVFSILGAVRTMKEMFHVLSSYGLYDSICTASFRESEEVTAFWTWMFALSKLVELGDTIFVVLRKQPLMFLHWYHHITVLLYTWHAFKDNASIYRWVMVMNYGVHSVMYSYYAFRAMGYRVPKFIMMSITSMQIVQMIFGCLISYWSYVYLMNSRGCSVSIVNIIATAFLYLNYLMLFGRFFCKSYIISSGAKKRSSISNITRTYRDKEDCKNN